MNLKETQTFQNHSKKGNYCSLSNQQGTSIKDQQRWKDLNSFNLTCLYWRLCSNPPYVVLPGAHSTFAERREKEISKRTSGSQGFQSLILSKVQRSLKQTFFKFKQDGGLRRWLIGEGKHMLYKWKTDIWNTCK